MNQEVETGIFNSVHNEAIVSQLDKQSNTEEHLNSAFISEDELIARKLQHQIDLEYNQKLRSWERLQNGTSKLNVSYEKYRKYENYDDYEEETFDDSDQQDNLDRDQFEVMDGTFDSLPPCSYVFSTSGGVVTKHDISLNGPKNVKQHMNLPPNIQTNNRATLHMEIPNSVFNGLKRHSQIDWHRENIHYKKKYEDNQHKKKKDKRNNLQGIDQSTNDTIQSLFKGVEPCLKQLYAKIADGKESVIYHAKAAGNAEIASCDCILKLYKFDVHDLELQEKCISGDYRYKDYYNSNMSKHNIICLWAKKEKDNLIRMNNHNIPCPEIIKRTNNVLVMSFIGANGARAMKLQYARMSPNEYKKAYKQVVRTMYTMYKEVLLIHGDLSESNILWYNDKCYFIDVSQAVEPSHESAFEYLKRDCRKVIRFFKMKKVEDIMTKEELFEYITGLEFDDVDGIERLRTSFKTYIEVMYKRTNTFINEAARV